MSELCAYHLRENQERPAVRYIDGEGLCAQCYAGKPLNAEQEAGDLRFDPAKVERVRELKRNYYYDHRTAVLRRMKAQRERKNI